MTFTRPIILIRWNLPVGGKYALRVQSLRRENWHEKRIALFQKYTLPGLLRQGIRDFHVWLLCDPKRLGEMDELRSIIPDDRFAVASPDMLPLEAIDECDTVPVIRIDSDDIFQPAAVTAFLDAIPKAEEAGKRFIQSTRGHAYHIETGHIYEWDNPSPPFFAALIPWADLPRVIQKDPGIIHHAKVHDQAYLIDEIRLFCVTLSDTNICNSIAASWLGRRLKGAEETFIKEAYGIA